MDNDFPKDLEESINLTEWVSLSSMQETHRGWHKYVRTIEFKRKLTEKEEKEMVEKIKRTMHGQEFYWKALGNTYTFHSIEDSGD